MWSICRARILHSWSVLNQVARKAQGASNSARTAPLLGQVPSVLKALWRLDKSLSFALSTSKHFTDITVCHVSLW